MADDGKTKLAAVKPAPVPTATAAPVAPAAAPAPAPTAEQERMKAQFDEAMKLKAKSEAATPRPPPKPFNPEESPRGHDIKIPDDEWKVIHGDTPERIYELRPRAWRPLAPAPGLVADTPSGLFGSFQWMEKHCSRCGVKRCEVISLDGALRCAGCGNSNVKVAAKS